MVGCCFLFVFYGTSIVFKLVNAESGDFGEKMFTLQNLYIFGYLLMMVGIVVSNRESSNFYKQKIMLQVLLYLPIFIHRVWFCCFVNKIVFDFSLQDMIEFCTG